MSNFRKTFSMSKQKSGYLKSSSRVRSASSVQLVRSVRSGGLSSDYYSSDSVGSYSPVLAILLIILVTMLFFTCVKYFFTGSDRVYFFTDMLNFFGNVGSLDLIIPSISSVSTGISIIDTLLNSIILGINCLTFIFSSLINLVRLAFYVIQFIFFY